MATPNNKLESARMHKRWSIAVASERAGVSVNTFNRWERGLQVPQLGTLDQVCKAFDLSPEELGFEQAISAKRRVRSTREKQAEADNTTTPCFSPAPREFTPAPVEVGSPSLIITQQQPINELAACLEQAQRSLESMSRGINQDQQRRDEFDGVSRRQAIAALISTPAAVFGVTQGTNPVLLHPEEVLALCTVNIPLSWQLYFEGGLAEVERILPGYLSQLTTLTHQPSRYQKRAASLASQGYQLASLLEAQYQNFGLAHTYASKAFDYGALADDPNLQTTSLIRQAQVYLYLKHPKLRLYAYQRAMQYVDRTSPLLQGRVYIGLTETHSKLGNEGEARHFLELAHQTFPEHYAADPNFSYTHFNHWSLFSFEGMMFLHLKQPEQAWESFAQVDKTIPTGVVPNRVELTVRQAETAFALDDRDQTCTSIASAITAARMMGNQLRLTEAYKVYEDMQIKWGHERQVKELEHLLQLQ